MLRSEGECDRTEDEVTDLMRQGKPRRHYPPQRDSLFEQSAIAREMFRL